jgi:hypothetical protein
MIWNYRNFGQVTWQKITRIFYYAIILILLIKYTPYQLVISFLCFLVSIEIIYKFYRICKHIHSSKSKNESFESDANCDTKLFKLKTNSKSIGISQSPRTITKQKKKHFSRLNKEQNFPQEVCVQKLKKG